MDLDNEIAKLKELKLAFNSGCKQREFSGIRFECFGNEFKCEIWFCEIHSEAYATSISESFFSARDNLMNIAKVVSYEESDLFDIQIENKRLSMYEKWDKSYPSEKFNLILAIDRNLV